MPHHSRSLSHTLSLDQQYYYNQGQQDIQEFNATMNTWNEYMSSFKICQPCRAYNLQQKQNRDNNKHERRNNYRRILQGGGEEQERYNCEDKAGYMNVNQCYKFESKTRMELATSQELARASEQGSILYIEAYDGIYGEGGYYVSALPAWDTQNIYIALAILVFCSVVICVGCIARVCWRSRHGKLDKTASSLGETFREDFDGKEHANASSSLAKSGAGTTTRWHNRFTKKNKLNDIESGAYNPPTSPSLPPSKDGEYIKASTECADGTFAEKDDTTSTTSLGTSSLVSDHDSPTIMEHAEEVKLEVYLERHEESYKPSDNIPIANNAGDNIAIANNPSDDVAIASSKKKDSPAAKQRLWKRISKRIFLA